MTLTVLFEGTVPKDLDSADDNEDVYRTAPERGRLMVSDGASESFDARRWADLLVDRMIDDELSQKSVAYCAQDYEALYDRSSLSWSKAAAYERGSFATLLIVQDRPERNVVCVTAVGDSLAVWTDGHELLASIPYTLADQFRDKPTLLATRLAMNADEGEWEPQEWSYEGGSNRILLCMTDALGAWLLTHQEQGDFSAVETLCGMRDGNQLRKLVESERAAGRMRRDDTTLIVASFTQT